MLTAFAKLIGANEAALRLLISLLLGYPMAALYRNFIFGRKSFIQHIYFTICGIFLCCFNFGAAVSHSLLNIVIIYVILLIVPGTVLSLVLSFLVNFGYLCWGYWVTMDDKYSFTWTMPHCVLTLRLTGLAFDVFDGKKKAEHLSKEQMETALSGAPSLLEILGHVYYFGGFLVGPQFPMKRYKDFVEGAFADKITGAPPRSVSPALKRLSLGLMYTGLYQVTSMYLPDSYLLAPEFQERNMIMKCFLILLWGKLMLYKYEGACILSGLTYNGKDENGNNLWNYCANIHVNRYETASTCAELIEGFNVNTNKWMAKYIFKRLKWAGNRHISSMATMFVLALWHGLHSGYFFNFSFEFFVMLFERQMAALLMSIAVVKSITSTPSFKFPVWLVKKFYSQFILSYALVSFCLLTLERYSQVYSSVYWVGHVACFVSLAGMNFMRSSRKKPE